MKKRLKLLINVALIVLLTFGTSITVFAKNTHVIVHIVSGLQYVTSVSVTYKENPMGLNHQGGSPEFSGWDFGEIVLSDISSIIVTCSDRPDPVIYAPAKDYAGVEGNGGTINYWIKVEPVKVNRAPAAKNDSYSTTKGKAITVSVPGVLGNDTDPDGDTLIAQNPSKPMDSSNNVKGEVKDFVGDGSFTYIPPDGFTGTVTFTYDASDGKLSSTATVTILVVDDAVEKNDPPVASDDNYSTPYNTLLSVCAPGILGNDMDPEGSPLSFELVQGPAHAIVFEYNEDNGSFNYKPDTDIENCSVTFTYRAFDGEKYSNLATVTISIGSKPEANNPPVAQDDEYTMDQGETLEKSAERNVLCNDRDPDYDPLSVEEKTGPQHAVEFVLYADGTFKYIPDSAYYGTDTFTYAVYDGKPNSSDTATVTINIKQSQGGTPTTTPPAGPTNNPPVAVDDNYSTNKNTTLVVAANDGVLSNDRDNDGDRLSSAVVINPSHGSLSLNSDGSFVYVPENGYTGNDSFKYKANDGNSDSNIATVFITVNDNGSNGQNPGSEDDEVILDEEIPGGPANLPKTGEVPPEFIYGLGIAVTAVGIRFRKKH